MAQNILTCKREENGMLVEYPDLTDANSNKFIHNNIAFASIIWDIDQTCIVTYLLPLVSTLNKLSKYVLFFCDGMKDAILSLLIVAYNS